MWSNVLNWKPAVKKLRFYSVWKSFPYSYMMFAHDFHTRSLDGWTSALALGAKPHARLGPLCWFAGMPHIGISERCPLPPRRQADSMMLWCWGDVLVRESPSLCGVQGTLLRTGLLMSKAPRRVWTHWHTVLHYGAGDESHWEKVSAS